MPTTDVDRVAADGVGVLENPNAVESAVADRLTGPEVGSGRPCGDDEAVASRGSGGRHALDAVPSPRVGAEAAVAPEWGAAPAAPVARTRAWPRVEVGGISFDAASHDQVIAHVRASLGAGLGGLLMNVEAVSPRRWVSDEARAAARGADLVVAETVPPPWSRRALRRPPLVALTGMSLLWGLARGAAQDDRRVFMLCGPPGGAAEAGAVLNSGVPNLAPVGAHDLPAIPASPAVANADVLVALGAFAPDIVALSYDVPDQIALAVRLRLMFPETWFVACGRSVSFVL